MIISICNLYKERKKESEREKVSNLSATICSTIDNKAVETNETLEGLFLLCVCVYLCLINFATLTSNTSSSQQKCLYRICQ